RDSGGGGVDSRGDRLPEDRQRARSYGWGAVAGRREAVARAPFEVPELTVMKRMTVPEEGIGTLFGSYDENLKHLETLFNVRIRTQGHELLVDGEPSDLERVDRVVGQLSSLMRDGYKLSSADVKTAADLVAQDDTVDVRDHFLKGSLTAAGKRRVAPKSVNQRRYLDAIEQHDIVFGIGPAGTGKTYLAMAQAVSFLIAK